MQICNTHVHRDHRQSHHPSNLTGVSMPMYFDKAWNCAVRMSVSHWSYTWHGPYAAAFAVLIRVLASSSVGWAAIAPGFEHV